jgi:oligopeptide/dipeptide ABC transporter ATP-binding protein
MSEPILEVSDLRKHFRVSGRLSTSKEVVYAVDGVSFSISQGEVLGLVGESGSGKSTTGKCIMRLLEPTSGSIKLHGHDITHFSRRRVRPYRRTMHMVFQDPYSSLNPRMTCGQIVSQPLRLHKLASGSKLDARVAELFDKVGLRPELRTRYPHELSGGQRQRVGLARALSVEPSLLIADEPVSALDVSVQASILNLLMDLQRDLGFACLFIAHDLSTVEYFCDHVAVMYLGKIVELASRERLFGDPKHPYTQSLLSAVPVPDPHVQRARRRIVLEPPIRVRVPHPLSDCRGAQQDRGASAARRRARPPGGLSPRRPQRRGPQTGRGGGRRGTSLGFVIAREGARGNR